MQTWTPAAFVLLHHRNKGALVLFHPGIGLGFNRKQQKQFAEPDMIDSELKSAFGDSRRADEHPVLAVGLLQFLWCHRPTRNAHLTRMFYVPNQQGCRQANVPPRSHVVLDFCRRSVSNSALFCKHNIQNMSNMHIVQEYAKKNRGFTYCTYSTYYVFCLYI